MISNIQNICRTFGAARKNGLVLSEFSVFQLFKIYFPIIQVSQFDFAPWSCNRPQYVLAWTLSPPSTPLTEGCLKKLMVCSPYCLISPGFFSYSFGATVEDVSCNSARLFVFGSICTLPASLSFYSCGNPWSPSSWLLFLYQNLYNPFPSHF